MADVQVKNTATGQVVTIPQDQLANMSSQWVPFTISSQKQELVQPTYSTTLAPIKKGQLPIELVSQITQNLTPGATGSQVTALQKALVAAGYMTQTQMNTGPGTYGPSTTAAVAAWQKDNNISTNGANGYFGPASKAFITSANTSPTEAPAIHPDKTKEEYSSEIVSVTNSSTGQTISIPKDQLSNISSQWAVASNVPGSSADTGSTSYASALPDEAYNSYTGKLTAGTPEYQAAMDKINTAYYDVLEQQINAQTEQQKQLADYNWNTLKTNIEKTLNISLSNDAISAWDQIKTLGGQYGQQGTSGSGFQAEDVDNYLRKIRANDVVTRENSQSSEDTKMQTYYTSYASAGQIKDLIAKDPEKAKAWGLIPSDEIKAAMSPSALKAKYPTATDEEINKYVASMFDENGNYRSSLYQKQLYGTSVGINPGTTSYTLDENGRAIDSTVSPGDIGTQDIAAAKKQAQTAGVNVQQSQLYYANQDKLNATTNRGKYSTETPTSTTTPADTTTPTKTNPLPNITGSSVVDPNAAKAVSEAAKKLGSGTVTSPASTSLNIPFKTGLSDAQKQSITQLSSKTTWNANDLKNWNYATNSAKTPSGALVKY